MGEQARAEADFARAKELGYRPKKVAGPALSERPVALAFASVLVI